MKWAYHIRHKVKATAVLLTILLTIVFVQVSNQLNMKKMDKSVSSLYNDRLMPATYLFEISNHLYQQRLDNEHAVAKHTVYTGNRVHNNAINQLIKNYESTYLTEKEKKAWGEFKTALNTFNTSLISSDVTSPQYEMAFNTVIASLGTLTNIQVGESNNINKESKTIVGRTDTYFQLEAAMLIVLGLFAVVLLSISDKALFFKQQSTSLN